MAGYSGTPLVRKLGIKAGNRVILVKAPDRARSLLADVPDGVRIGKRLSGQSEFVLAFCERARDLSGLFDRVMKVLTRDGMVWIAWPKKSSGMQKDVDESLVRKTGLNSGLVDVKICAIDDTWSGLKFVYRLRDRG